jgi:hypothetical protein
LCLHSHVENASLQIQGLTWKWLQNAMN